MPALAINGGDVVYEILGVTGDLIVLTPGGRFGKDIPGADVHGDPLPHQGIPAHRPPWPEDASERASELRAAGKVERYNGFDTWVHAAPAIQEFLAR